jgi:hypothetical protein
MLNRVVRFVVPRALAAEALYTALWLAGLLPGLAGRNAVALGLISGRATVAAVQGVAAWLLLSRSTSGQAFATAALIGSAPLLPFETGWRLAPTNLDPTYSWWVVGAYWMYAAAAIVQVRTPRR